MIFCFNITLDKHSELIQWCLDNLKNEWEVFFYIQKYPFKIIQEPNQCVKRLKIAVLYNYDYNKYYYDIKNTEEAILFKLKWGGYNG